MRKAKTELMVKLETEFDEPLKAILQGFIDMGYGITETAETLSIAPATLRKWRKKLGLVFPRGKIIDPPSNAKRCEWTFNGQTKSISEWAEALNIDRNILYARKYIGWDVEKILTTPHRGHGGARQAV